MRRRAPLRLQPRQEAADARRADQRRPARRGRVRSVGLRRRHAVGEGGDAPAGGDDKQGGRVARAAARRVRARRAAAARQRAAGAVGGVPHGRRRRPLWRRRARGGEEPLGAHAAQPAARAARGHAEPHLHALLGAARRRGAPNERAHPPRASHATRG
eukprot:5774870-Prymnesium_polylepis.1